MAEEKTSWKNILLKNRTLLIISSVAIIVLIGTGIVTVGYLIYTTLNPSGQNDMTAWCEEQCHAAQGQHLQPITFCNGIYRVVNGVIYTCPNQGFKCNVDGYIYDENTCKKEYLPG